MDLLFPSVAVTSNLPWQPLLDAQDLFLSYPFIKVFDAQAKLYFPGIILTIALMMCPSWTFIRPADWHQWFTEQVGFVVLMLGNTLILDVFSGIFKLILKQNVKTKIQRETQSTWVVEVWEKLSCYMINKSLIVIVVLMVLIPCYGVTWLANLVSHQMDLFDLVYTFATLWIWLLIHPFYCMLAMVVWLGCIGASKARKRSQESKKAKVSKEKLIADYHKAYEKYQQDIVSFQDKLQSMVLMVSGYLNRYSFISREPEDVVRGWVDTWIQQHIPGMIPQPPVPPEGVDVGFGAFGFGGPVGFGGMTGFDPNQVQNPGGFNLIPTNQAPSNFPSPQQQSGQPPADPPHQ